MPDDVAALAVVVARLDDMREQSHEDTRALADSIKRVEQRLDAMGGEMVHRDTGETRNAHVDAHLALMDAQIAETRVTHRKDVDELKDTIRALRHDVESRHDPWWTVGSLLVAGLALARNLIPALAR